MEQSKDSEFREQIQKNMKHVAESIKLSSNLPVGSVRTNFVACFPRFKDEVGPFSDKILDMLTGLLQREGIKGNLEDNDNEEKIDLVVDGVNKILDRVRDNLNELNGVKCHSSVQESIISLDKNFSGSWNRDASKLARWKTNSAGNYSKPALRTQNMLEKPQDKFEVKIDNSNMPFEPHLASKPNAIKPLSVYLEMNPNGVSRYCHPYLHELDVFKIPPNQLKKVEPRIPPKIDTTRAVYVDDEKMLSDMISALKTETELAVDLEHHSYRSYQGLTCLMQISTRETDYIIDTLALRNKLFVLNEIFTNPNVVKVFHDANSDVLWLQKDFSLYVVNMFDTHLASLTLNFPKLSLSYLMKEFCNVESDKRYQLFDWRIRPLPDTALLYARTDTHYLLYIYDKLRNALLEKVEGSTQLLESVYSRGVSICKKKHEKLMGENDYLILYKQSKQTFDNRQMCALKSLYKWRDNVAREEDESTGYVLPNHMLLQIAEMLPREMQGILACCNPVPSLVRKNLSHLHQLISVSRHLPINRSNAQNDVLSVTLNKNPALSKLRCPHDFSHHDDFRDNLATLLEGSDVINISGEDEVPAISLLNDKKLDEKRSMSNSRRKTKHTVVKFVSPYERYKRTVVFLLGSQEKIIKEEVAEADIVYSPRENRQVAVESKPKPNVNDVSVRKSHCIIDKKQCPTKVKSEKSDEIVIAKGIKRKSLPSDEQLPEKKVAVEKTINSPKNDPIPVDDDSAVSEDQEEEELTEVTTASNNPKMKRRRNRKRKIINSCEPESDKPEFKPYDYTKANFSRFVTSGQKNIKKLLSNKITFGASHKGMKKKFRK